MGAHEILHDVIHKKKKPAASVEDVLGNLKNTYGLAHENVNAKMLK